MTPTAPIAAPARRAFTLIEAVMASLVVAVIFAGAAHVVGSAGATRARTALRSSGAFLAESLAAEILARRYSAAPVNTGSGAVLTIGLGGLDITLGGGGLVEIDVGGGETPTSPARAAFTTVDEYEGLKDSPPTDIEGNVIPGFSGWSRAVSVALVDPANAQTPAVSDLGLKLVTVTVKRGAATVETRKFLVSNVP